MRQFTPALSSFVLIFALGGCGNDQAADEAAVDTDAPPAAMAPSESAPMTTTAPDTEAAAPTTAATSADGELVYDPIDVSKLDNQWWRQYSGSGG